uniref:URB2 ribosome biosis homolog n=1 Tax=Salvator merianae TaxID=96440 RepID=A0A8D0EAI8_SALMN
MAAIYSGIHLKLKSTKTSWEDKLKLAQFAWISHQCFLPNKEQVLLDWVSHTLVSCYNKKLELSDEIIEKLWMYLDSILRSRKLQNLIKDGKPITLRFSIAQVINGRLSNSYTQKTLKNIGTVLSCCGGILSVPSLAIVYTAKFELLVDLLSQLSRLACWQLSSEDAVTSQLFEVLQMTFGQYLLVQRQQANPNRVFGQVSKHLFQPCLLLRHLLTNRTWTESDASRVRQHLSKEIRNNIEMLLKTAVFQAELLSSYREELLEEKESHNLKKGSLKNLLLPASTIQAALRDTDFYQPPIHMKVVANSVPLLFKHFLESYDKAENSLLCFHMFTRLFQCLRISCLQGQIWNNQLSPSEWGPELLALEQLLNSVFSSGTYNVAADKIRHNGVQFHFYRQLAELLVNHSQATIPAWFRCLKALLSLNHLILEPDLDDLVASAWIDAEVSESRTKKAQEAFVGSLFHTYAKLRQFQKLFEEILSVICRPALEELRLPVLPASIRTKLCECLLDLPPNQILDIVSLILEKCQTFVIPYVKDDSDAALKLQSMGTLLHSILCHMKTLDDSSPLPVLHRAQNVLEKMQKEVIQALFDLLKDCHMEEVGQELWTEKVSDTVLLLACTWVEVDILFGLNCSKYVSPLAKKAPSPDDSALDIWDFSDVLPGLDAQCWEKMNTLLSCFCSGSRYCTEWLVLQKMKKMLMHARNGAESSHQTLQSFGAFILRSGRSYMHREEGGAWDGNAGNITSFTYPAAHWHLVVSNLPVLVPYLSVSDAVHIAGILLKSLLVNQTQPIPEDDDDSLITVRKVSEDLLGSSLFPEMRVLHSSFLSQIVQRCVGVLYAAVQNAASHPLQQLCVEDTPWCDIHSSGYCMEPSSNPSACWTVLEKVAQNTLSLVKRKSYVILDEVCIQRILDILEIMSTLNLDGFFPLDHARCFLVLFSLIVNTRANYACNEDLLLKYLTACFHLLTCLQVSRNANASFKVLHASDVLEALLISTFEVCKTSASTLAAASWDKFLNGVKTFLERYLQVTLERRQSVKLNLEKFMSFLATCRPCSATDKSSGNWSPADDQLQLVAITAVCHSLTLHFQQQHEKWQSSGMLSVLLKRAVLQTGEAIQLSLTNNNKGHPLPLAFIPCITTLLKADSSCSRSGNLVADENGQEISTKPSKPQQQLFYSELYQRFYDQILRELGLAGDNVQFLCSALQFLTVFCSIPDLFRAQETSVAVFQSIGKLLAGPEITVQVIQDLEAPLSELMAQLLQNCTVDDFSVMLKLTLEGLDIQNIWKQNPEKVLAAVTLVKVLLGCPLSGEKSKAFWLSTPQIITALLMQTKEASQDPMLIPILIIPILETVAALLRQGEGILSNPHHVSLVFSILLTVPLDQKEYGSIFLGVHEVLFSILQCHPKVMLKAAPSFLNSFNRLVVSVMHEGRQKGDKGISDEFEIVLKCAQLVERMFTYIAAKTEEFTVLSAFIVAQYVTELQKVCSIPSDMI